MQITVLRAPWPVVLKPGLLALFAALSVGGGMLVATRRLQHTGHLWLTWQDAAAVGALTIAGLVLHETGHAVAARATGRLVERLEFGLAGGAVTSGDTTPWRRAIAIATGPLLELAFGFTLLTAGGGTWAALATPLGTAGLMAIINGAGNLLPVHPSLDGYRLLTFLRLALTGNRRLNCVPEGPCPACTGNFPAQVLDEEQVPAA
ncbi:peptidase M50 (plasmid) [Pseudarthrobacter chlorophenolicus A6]|uniref:Peptidase M50 n=1 Tax=Pseudarthrobacter chlorophenolicus (strain ATCC 700700 / DSM 12829 / CIP 107037 / JCM 12360 / KCTC 9906 / NCIMB 13794 / A6) TaxID=452863 RepID=B8HHK0_PSECP|nr:M50 family metallopeptidase [Pseudarthrobacter chlorophenolicus]ACL41897.1 peptidase M50 [Pseudarthrobacter chlorophenolicus A6]SDQ18336.1 Peptidase family M50 [Pseudarthrobacter chlorophenolicus]